MRDDTIITHQKLSLHFTISFMFVVYTKNRASVIVKNSGCLSFNALSQKVPGWHSWLNIRFLISAQVMISQFVSLSPTLGSAHSAEPAWDSVFLSLCPSSSHTLSLKNKYINITKRYIPENNMCIYIQRERDRDRDRQRQRDREIQTETEKETVRDREKMLLGKIKINKIYKTKKLSLYVLITIKKNIIEMTSHKTQFYNNKENCLHCERVNA